MLSFGSNSKMCVTCSYWDGPRRPKGINCEIDGNLQGKCYVVSYVGISTNCTFSCPKWEKWKALR